MVPLVTTSGLFAYIHDLLPSKIILNFQLAYFIPQALVRVNRKTIKIYKNGKFSYLQFHEEGKLKLMNVIRSIVLLLGAE